MNALTKWIEFGRAGGDIVSARNVRRWINQARDRLPMIDRVQFPETGNDQRLSRRG